MSSKTSAVELAQTAATSSKTLQAVSSSARSNALTAVHDALRESKDAILAANQADMADALSAVEAGKMRQSLAKRLLLSEPKWEAMLSGILEVRDLPDPLANVTLATKLDEGLSLYRVSAPIGVLLVIFEARPEVIANITALALKSGNAVILKGGKESSHSFAAIAKVVSEALAKTEIPPGAVQLVQTREDVNALLSQDEFIDLVIPRGGNDLVRYIKEHTKIPVMGHADGICAAYVHGDADVEKSVKVVVDSKTDYPAACNAMETLLVHESAVDVLVKIAGALLQAGVSLRCEKAAKAALLASGLDAAHKAILQDAEPADFDTEFLELTAAVKLVSSLDEAVAHINKHGSGHTDVILTESETVAEDFMRRVDSAGVFWNASSRFADGYRYGFGTEVGISTNKIHARGPVGLEGLTIYKYQLRGNGQAAADYGAGKKAYLHKKIDL